MGHSHLQKQVDGIGIAGEAAPYVDSSHRQPWVLGTSLQTSVVVVCSFLAVALFMRHPLPPEKHDIYLLSILIVLGIFFQVYQRSHTAAASSTLSELSVRKTMSWVLTLLFITLIVVLTDLRSMPRLLLFAVVLLSFALDLAGSLIKYSAYPDAHQVQPEPRPEDEVKEEGVSYAKAMTGFILLGFSLVTAMSIKSAGVQLYWHYEQLFVIVTVAWLLSAWITNAYGAAQGENIYYRVAPILKLSVGMALLSAMFYWYGQFEYLSRGVLFGSVAIFAMLQLLVEALTTRSNGAESVKGFVPVSANSDAGARGGAADGPGHPGGFRLDAYVPEQVVVDGREELQEFLQEALPAVNSEGISVVFWARREYIDNVRSNRTVLINMQGLNFVHNLNDYLRATRGAMSEGGFLVTWTYPLDKTYSRLRSKMPKSVFVLVYPMHFLLFRIAPKLPLVGTVYFYFTRGRYSNISQAEYFGRLAYNGFSVVNTREINHKLHVVARADREPVRGVEPSFGIIAKLNRIGYRGQKVTIYKIRTMHPYSEFIQGDIFAKNGLTDTGKIRDDYRVTWWGRLLRKYWLDELPQVYNWLRGDIRLVGVRAVSEQYFSLYPGEVQKLRVKYKPGLIPPLYADMPGNFGEIVESERRYLLSRSKSPFMTDVKYFFKAIQQIVLRSARSR